ncbi:T9SS type A sorting domain-containing protein [Longitalea arenae]|uniref:T9SS type A sorting domain-containing protein n=1 Tax=Longitalea arenae TaxID=2812558 RepID=UPI00196897B2|nr:T9SS type A sorting domain-containing protein [Longitalea arenae]
MMAVNVITTRPNPFISSLTLEITASEDQPGVVRMADPSGKIISLFLWKLKKGVNISNINNLNKLDTGMYLLDVMDEKGHIMCSTQVVK